LQKLFSRQELSHHDILHKMLQSERAVTDYDLQALDQNKVSLMEVARLYGRRLAFSTNIPKADEFLLTIFPELLVGWGNRPQAMAKERLDALRYFEAAFQWSKLPEQELIPRLDQWEQTGPFLSRFLHHYQLQDMSSTSKSTRPELDQLRRLARACLNDRASLRAVNGLLASERHRLAKGKLPATWEDLTPEFLQAKPIDPFTGKPMILKTVPDGLVIYSVGHDGKDDGGKVFYTLEQQPIDRGYRLWINSQRGINVDEQLAEYLKRQKEE
jgi:hypothetical protein